MRKLVLFLLIYSYSHCLSPVFTQSKWIEKKVLDVGENASICVVDFDHDGKKDLIIGNKEGYILFYKNTGSDQNPSFQAPTKIEIDTGNIKLEYGFASVVVAQWDGIRDLDLIIGDGAGQIFRALAINNDVVSGNPPTYNTLEKLQADGKSINLGGNASPYVFDVDEDGKLDLLAGDIHGYVWFFKNISEGNPNFVLLSAGTKTLVGSETLDVSQNAKPIIVDWDNDGKKDLIVGDKFGNIHIFTPGTQTGTGTFIPSFIFKEKAKVANKDIDVGFCASPFMCNWNNEGGYDLLVGAASGEVSLFLNIKLPVETEPPEFNIEQKLGGEKLLEENEKYSKPYVIDWNNDGKKDIIIGGEFGKVRLFLNSGEDKDPIFTDGFIFQVTQGTLTQDLDVGYNASPFPCDWNNDGKKDLIVGNSLGEIWVFINTKTDEAPIFSQGTKTASIDRYNAVPYVCDWNDDGKKDIIVGCTDKNLRLFLNIGSDKTPVFGSSTTINLPLADERNIAPCIIDWNRDYKKDILVGAGYGELYLFINSGSNDVPVFTEKKSLMFENGSPIKTSGYASPCITDWDNNFSPDLLIGGEDGRLLLSLSILSNSPPSLVVNTPQGTQSGNVNISYTLRDEDSDTCLIDVKFSKDGGFIWNDATSGSGGDGKTGLFSSGIGISHIFVWDSGADLGQGIYNIILQITPNDGTNPGLSYKTGTFPLNNTTQPNLIPIQVSGKNLDIGAYSIPFVCDWNNDNRKDLLVGDEYGYIMLFFNSGTDENPLFTSYARFQAREATSTLIMKDLKVDGFSSPCVINYNNDGKKDLLVGDKFGYVYYFENIGTDEVPILQKGARIQGGSDLDVGNMANPVVIDYNKDGKKDLIIGDEYGYIRLYLNSGSDDKPIFSTGTKLLLGTGNTEINVGYNSTPSFVDWNKNGKRDLVVGDRDGYLWLFLNYGNDENPQYDNGTKLTTPYVSGNASCFIVDWNNDSKFDLILGDRNGSVYLYQLQDTTNTPPSCSISPISAGASTITVKYKLYDIDGDTCSIIPEYSLNGIDWKSATGNPKDNLVGSSFGFDQEFIWNSTVDLPQTKTLVYFRITPKDKASGLSSPPISFLLDNLNTQPSIKRFNLSSNSGLIEVLFELEDLDYDTMTVSLEWLLPSGTWTKASVYGSSSFTPGISKLYWASSYDFPETETSLEIRLTASDSWSIGIPKTQTLKIENLRFSSKEVGTANVGIPITFSPTSFTLLTYPGYDLIITMENLIISSSIPGLSDCGRKIIAVRKDMPNISINNLSANLSIPYNNQFSEEIEKSFVIYKENFPLPSLVDTASNTVKADISSTGLYRIDAVFPFDSKVNPYPNPCKAPYKDITFPMSGRIKIFTITGQLVKEIDENAPRVWDTKNMDGKDVASGIYIWLVEKKKGIVAVVR